MTTATTPSRRPSVRPETIDPRPRPVAPGFIFPGHVLAFPGAANLCESQHAAPFIEMFNDESDAIAHKDHEHGMYGQTEPRRCFVCVCSSDYEPSDNEDDDDGGNGMDAKLIPLSNGDVLLVSSIDPPVSLNIEASMKRGGFRRTAWIDAAFAHFMKLDRQAQVDCILETVGKRNAYRAILRGDMDIDLDPDFRSGGPEGGGRVVVKPLATSEPVAPAAAASSKRGKAGGKDGP